MIATSHQKSPWESDGEAWKHPSRRQREHSHECEQPHEYLKNVSLPRKQIKPSQEAADIYKPAEETMDVYATKRKRTASAIFYGESFVVWTGDQNIATATFRALADQWKRETGHFSVFALKAEHPLYQAIIDMGERMLPALMAELNNSPRNWFWALRKIAGVNPVRKGASVEEAVQDWTQWWMGKKKADGSLD